MEESKMLEQLAESDLVSFMGEHMGELEEQWREAIPGSEEQERIHKQLMEQLRINKELSLYTFDKSEKAIDDRRKRKEFWINTGLTVGKILIPAGLSVALLRYSSNGGYMSGDESKAFGWLFGMANQKT